MFLKITADIVLAAFQSRYHYILNFCRLCIDFPETNRPFLELGHVLVITKQRLARWQAIQAFIHITKL